MSEEFPAGWATWLTRKWGESRPWRITVRAITALFLALFGLTGRYVQFQRCLQGEGSLWEYLLFGTFVLCLLFGLFFAIHTWVGEESVEDDRKQLRLRAAKADEVVKEAKRDLAYRQQLIDLVGQVVELKADHYLAEITKKRADPSYVVAPYSPHAQMEKILIVVVEFFGQMVAEETGNVGAEVFGAYFIKNGSHLVPTYSRATRDHTWTCPSHAHSDRFDLDVQPARSALIDTVHAGINMRMIEDCEAAHSKGVYCFQYFEQPREQEKNKSMLIYVVRDVKGNNECKGAFCIYTTEKGFFDPENRRRRDLCEDFMQQMTQRMIYEHRQADLTFRGNGS